MGKKIWRVFLRGTEGATLQSNRAPRVRSLGSKRQSLPPSERQAIKNKTGGRCHICGGHIEVDSTADHAFAHAQGGLHRADNYLPAHPICNQYRWFF